MADQYRQGHILLIRRELPPTAQLASGFTPGHIVLARGETGREHVFKSDRVRIYQEGSDLFIEIVGDDPVLLEHPEHGDFEVEPGTYRLVEQIEADPERLAAARKSYD